MRILAIDPGAVSGAYAYFDDDGWPVIGDLPVADGQLDGAFFGQMVRGMDPQAAIEAPRVYSQSFPNSFAPHTYQPGNLRIEAGIDAATVDALAAKGHAVERWPDAEWSRTGMCAVLSDQETGVKIGAADPRRTCYALGA